MVQTVIAKCENCGAALRVSEAAGGTVTCEYCGTASMVGAAPGAAGGAPTVRIDPPPRPQFSDGVTTASSEVGAKMVLAALGTGALLLFIWSEISPPLGPSQPNPLWLQILFVGGPFLTYWLLWLSRKKLTRAKAQAKQREDEYQWFRDNGLPARATVERIRAGDGRHATLGLKIELSGQPERHIEHEATIPELLVPRLVDGLTLPVIVHPNEPDKIEIQWHLV